MHRVQSDCSPSPQWGSCPLPVSAAAAWRWWRPNWRSRTPCSGADGQTDVWIRVGEDKIWQKVRRWSRVGHRAGCTDMAVDSSAWWPGGRTTAKPFWCDDRQTARQTVSAAVAPTSALHCASCWTHLQLPRRYPEGQLDDGAHGHADGCRGVHLIPHGVAVHLQGAAAESLSSTTEHSALRLDRLAVGRVALTPIPPQGSTAYIFWLIGPERANQRVG